ncbi:aldose epimerase family protein [Martelella alba]|uniref:Galactose mutarotase-like enzyme n=1 Tax=Martelella alba TaxID=2590451 RepID=A0ABY2SFY4_9HYPH|nr:hypothetical protein [Martelella alba]TKI03957.1 hypothetical protein FCN80_19760 [Martelella alba]
MTILTLDNRMLTLSVRLQGAEMCGLTENAAGRSRHWLWRPGETGWQSSAPILFPIVGQLRHNGVYYAGQFWPLPAHGFLRRQPFTLVEQRKDRLRLCCSDSEETRRLWPFRWGLLVAFKLYDRQVCVTYRLTNRGDTPLWFSLGSHPGFALPIHRYPGWKIGFHSPACRGPWPTYRRTLAIAADADTPRVSELPLSDETFRNGALYFSRAEQQRLDIIDPRGHTALRFNTGDHPWLALWSQPGADLLCIEPLFGTTDAPDANGQLQHKRGIQQLSAGDTFYCRYSFTVIPGAGEEGGWNAQIME